MEALKKNALSLVTLVNLKNNFFNCKSVQNVMLYMKWIDILFIVYMS